MRISECEPHEAWSQLKVDESAVLVDVRSRAEWSFVGIPDLSALGRDAVLVEWRSFPGMAPNTQFAEQLRGALGPATPSAAYFICRSGARSMEAARMMAEVWADAGVPCINVAEGFEGDLDAEGHRGSVNGWKMRGLPWRQS